MQSQIAEEIQALSRHYPRTNRDPETELRWLRDYCDDLVGFSGAEVAEGARRWRQNPASRKCPTPGELAALCRTARAERAAGQDRPPPAVAGPHEPWRLDAGQVADMTLSEKIRYHRAMALHCRGRAGPMWKAGRPATPDELPDRWHSFTRQAQEHDYEAQRLTGRMMEARDRG